MCIYKSTMHACKTQSYMLSVLVVQTITHYSRAANATISLLSVLVSPLEGIFVVLISCHQARSLCAPQHSIVSYYAIVLWRQHFAAYSNFRGSYFVAANQSSKNAIVCAMRKFPAIYLYGFLINHMPPWLIIYFLYKNICHWDDSEQASHNGTAMHE